jgi:hypothetical protein
MGSALSMLFGGGAAKAAAKKAGDAVKGAGAKVGGAAKKMGNVFRRKAKYTEERVMSYTEPPPETLMSDKYMEAFVPGTYMTDKYTGSGGTSMQPGDYVGLPAAKTKTGTPTKPPTAAKANYPDLAPPVTRGPGVSGYLNNHPALPGGDVNDAMPLSPMVEKVVHPINFSLILLTILFIVFVSMRK